MMDKKARKRMEELHRLHNINQFIRDIASCGRGFFGYKGAVAIMILNDRGRVWFIDDYSGKWVYTHYTRGSWAGFTHGGTLRRLVEFFRDHIKRGVKMNPRYFEPRPDLYGPYDGGHPWGYATHDLAKIKKRAIKLGIMEKVDEYKSRRCIKSCDGGEG